MATQPAHSTIINRFAREAFQHLGIVQKGRSRTWLDDHGWWLINVEFQPSSCDRGTYLNVGAMWLWYSKDYFSFDVDYRAKGFVKYQNDMQFQVAMQPVIRLAVQRVRKYRSDFSSIGKVASYYKRKRRKNFWDLYNAGLAFGLAGDGSNASRLLSQLISIEDGRAWVKTAQTVARRFLAVSHSKDLFRAEATAEVQRARRLLKLSEYPDIKW
jgi:hypothetical protein